MVQCHQVFDMNRCYDFEMMDEIKRRVCVFTQTKSMHKLDSFQQIKKIEALNHSNLPLITSLRSDDPKEFEAARHLIGFSR